MNKLTKFCLTSIALLLVMFAFAAFCLAAGGVSYGTPDLLQQSSINTPALGG